MAGSTQVRDRRAPGPVGTGESPSVPRPAARRLSARLRAVAVAVLLALIGCAVPSLPATARVESFVVKSRFEANLYVVQGDPASWPSTRSPRTYLDLASWRALGSPRPVVWEPRYSSLPWSSTVYALTYWPDGGQRAEATALTYDQWRSAGSPPPQKDYRVCTDATFRCSTFTLPSSPSEIFLEEPLGGAPVHKLSYTEWVALGRPKPSSTDRPAGVYKLAWSPILFWEFPAKIGPVNRSTSNEHYDACGSRLSYPEWRDAGSPTPQVVAATSTSRFIQGPPRGYGYDDEIWYDGPAGFFHLSYGEWAAAGRPSPTAVSYTPALPASWACRR